MNKQVRQNYHRNSNTDFPIYSNLLFSKNQFQRSNFYLNFFNADEHKQIQNLAVISEQQILKDYNKNQKQYVQKQKYLRYNFQNLRTVKINPYNLKQLNQLIKEC
ncbi:hypothetical protein ABPG72_004067 [Tetrahymena utriculariae]